MKLKYSIINLVGGRLGIRRKVGVECGKEGRERGKIDDAPESVLKSM